MSRLPHSSEHPRHLPPHLTVPHTKSAMHAPPNRVILFMVECTGNCDSYDEAQRWMDSPYYHGTTRATLGRSYRRALSWSTRQPSYLPWVNAAPERASRRRHESQTIAHWPRMIDLVAADSGCPYTACESRCLWGAKIAAYATAD